MILEFCFGWFCCFVFIWLLLNKIDKSGKFIALFLNGNEHCFVHDPSRTEIDGQIQQLTMLVKENMELLQMLREIQPIGNSADVIEDIEEVVEEEVMQVNGRRNVGRRVNAVKKSSYKPVSVTKLHKEGYLYLQTPNSKTWTKYYIVLTTSQISIYNELNEPRLAFIKLNTVSLQEGNLKYSFLLQGPEEDSIVEIEKGKEDSLNMDVFANSCIFRSKDKDEIEQWMDSINNCINLTEQLVNEGEDLDVEEKNEEEDIFSDLDTEFKIEEEENVVETKTPQNDKIVNQDIYSVARNEKERNLLKEMVDKLEGSLNPKIHDGPTLFRFLKARGMNPTRGAAMMKARIEWESKVKPKEITLDMVRSEAVKKKGYFHGFDKDGRPSIIVRVGLHSPKTSDVDVMLKLVIFMVEKAIEYAPENIEDFAVIFDCTGFTVAQMDWTFVKEAISTLQNHYPERLGTLYVVNHPFVVNMTWKMVKPWLEPTTVDKIQFCDINKLLQAFDRKHLPSRLGGTSNFESTDFILGLETLNPDYNPPQ